MAEVSMTLKQNEITAIRSGSHLLPDSRAVVTCDLGSMITTITRTAWLSSRLLKNLSFHRTLFLLRA
jgi:hypothetical protein